MKSSTPKMAEHNSGHDSVPIIISGKGEGWFRLVGGKCVKGKLSQVNIKQSQALPNIKQSVIQSVSQSVSQSVNHDISEWVSAYAIEDKSWSSVIL